LPSAERGSWYTKKNSETVPVQTTKANWLVELKLYSFLTLALDMSSKVSRPGRFTSLQRNPVLFEQEPG